MTPSRELNKDRNTNIRGTKAFTSITNFRARRADTFVHSFLQSPVLPPVTANYVTASAGGNTVQYQYTRSPFDYDPSQFNSLKLQYVSLINTVNY